MTLRIALQMVRASLLQLVRDRKAVVMMLLVPVVLTAILSFALSDMFGGKSIPKFNLGIYNQDRGVISAALKQVFTSDAGQFAVKDVDSVQAGRTQLDRGTIDVFVTIPPNFTQQMESGAKVNVHVESTLNNSTKEQIVQSIVDSFGKQASIRAFAAKELGNQYTAVQPVQFRLQSSGLHPITAGSYYAVGMMVMFLLMQAVNRAETMVEERNSDRYRRLLAAPATRQSLCFGQWLISFVIVSLEGLVLLLCARFILNVQLGPWGQMIALTLSFAVALAGIATVLGAYVRNSQLINVVGMIAAQVLSVLGGSIFPVYSFPPFVQAIGNVVPNGLALNGFLNSISGTSTSDLAMPMMILCAIGIALGLVAGLRYGRTE
jgi:ABC-2 type transport system permease protein